MRQEAVVCPFCPLLCDDLVVEPSGERLELRAGGCPEARDRFAGLPAEASPTVDGRPVPLETALDRAAELLADARLPLISGLGCDVDGMRAVLRLAERLGGIVDHGASDGAFANLLAVQRRGWVTATLAEVRNRADLLLVFGPVEPGLMHALDARVLSPEATLFSEGRPARRRVQLGGAHLLHDAETISCPDDALHLAAALLRARVHGRPVAGAGRTGIPPDRLDGLAGALRAARYAAILWDAAALPRDTAELVVANLAGLLLELNRETRAVGLPLARSHHLVTAGQVCTWQWGVPLRSASTPDGPEYDPRAFAARRLLGRGDVDALLWVAAFPGATLPARKVPTVALVPPGEPAEADVVLPVGVPGIDHAGTAFRMDAVVALPLQRLRETALPSPAEVLDALAERLARYRATA